MLELLTDLMGDAEGRCAYAEARHVDVARARRSPSATARVDARRQLDESEGIGVRVRVGGGWGFAATRDVDPRRRRGGAGPRARASPRPSPRAPAAPLAPVAPAPRALGLALRASTRSPSPLEDKLELLFAAEAALRAATSASCARAADAAARGASARRSPRPRARRARRSASPMRRAASPPYAVDGGELQVRSYPTRPRRRRRGRAAGSTSSALDLAGHAPRVAEEAVELLTAPPCPEGTTHDRPRTASSSRCRSTSRSATRSSSTASCSARPPTPGRAGSAPDDLGSLRYGSEHAERHRRRDAARRRWARSAGTTRASPRARARRSSRAACCAPRCPTASRPPRSASSASGGCARADGFARQPIVRMTNVSLEPGDAGTLADLIADTDDGLYLRDQPLVVDRRPPPAVPVRHRGRPRDPRRRARAAVPQRLLRRDHAALLGLARRRLRPERVAAVGADELRQGRAGPGHGTSRTAPRRRASATCRSAWRDAPSAARARRARAAATPTARRRRRSCASARCSSRFARLAPDAGHRGRRHRRSRSCCVRDGPHRLGRHERARRRRRCATSPRAPTPPRAAAAAAGGPRRLPRPARSRRPRAPARRLRRRDRRSSTPARPARRAARGVRGCAARRAARRSGSGPRAPCDTAIASTRRRARAPTR